MQLKVFGLTNVGCKREHNEDYFISDNELGLHVVCDGMGGAAAGEVASEMAATIIKENMLSIKSLLDEYSTKPSTYGREKIKKAIDHAVNKATNEIHAQSIEDPSKKEWEQPWP